jgi:PAS domain S-box-containing protein
MSPQNSILSHLIEILDLLNKFIGDYPIYLYLTDFDCRLLWYNSFLEKQVPSLKDGEFPFCYSALWGLSEPCAECPKSKSQNHEFISREIIQRKFYHFEKEIFIEIISLPIKTSKEVVEGILGIGIDVTEHEMRQRALREKEKLFASIIDTTADAIFFVNNDEEILSWNKGAEDIFGYKPDEILGKSAMTLIPKELIELNEIHYIKNELKKNGFIKKYETQRVNKSGRLIYVDLTRTNISDSNDKIIGSSVILKDITSRKELEFELRRTILELSKLNDLDEILYGTHILDEILQIILIAITAGEGLRFNRAFLFLVDQENNFLNGHLAIGPANEEEAHRIWSTLQDQYRSLKEVVKNFKIDLHGSDHKLNEIVRNIHIPMEDSNNILVKTLRTRRAFLVKNGQVQKQENINFFSQGRSLFDILETDTFVVAPLSTKQELIGVLITDNRITHRDITEDEIESLKVFTNQSSMAIENAKLYKNLEERLNELQDAYSQLEENADRLLKAERLAAIGEMSAKVAHEIRNPLVSIGGFARLLEKKLPESMEIKKYTNIIKDQVSHLESILNNILVTASPPKPRFRKSDIHQIFHQVLSILDEILDKKKVKVELKFLCEDSNIWADEKMLHQVFLNILKNAIQAIDDFGCIIITTKCKMQNIHIKIKDNGIGISNEDIKRIYDPFFTTKSVGTGLGLSISQQIIRDHHGYINIFSQPGEGTEVQISLPRLRKGEQN